jgi:hypothetical protein
MAPYTRDELVERLVRAGELQVSASWITGQTIMANGGNSFGL